MADLRERGQIMLIAAFGLAVAFLAVAVMLNSVIYTENLATRGEDARGSEAIQFRADAVAGTEKLIEHANGNQTALWNISDISDELNSSVRSMSNGTAPIQAMDGLATQITLESMTEGRTIGQYNASRNFSSASGASNWDLTDNDINGTRSFRINVTRSSELAEASDSDPFTIEVDNGSSVWEVQIYREDASTNTTVNVIGAGKCTSGENPEIGLTAGTIDGQRCEALQFGAGVSPPYDIEFENAGNIQGNFSLVVNATSPDNLDTRYDPNEDSPFAVEAVYAATIHVYHESASHIYETDARAVPGESDD